MKDERVFQNTLCNHDILLIQTRIQLNPSDINALIAINLTQFAVVFFEVKAIVTLIGLEGYKYPI